MIDFLVSILEANINFQTVGAFILLYFFAIWLLLCFWVFVDAKRRYDRKLHGLIFFFIVLIFNFPGLIFYLIIRPEKNDDQFIYLQNNELVSDDSDKKGVEVPIINFIGEDGSVNLSFQLRINKAVMNNVQVSGSVDSSAPDVVQVNLGSTGVLPLVNEAIAPQIQVKSEEPSVSVESVDLSSKEKKSFKVSLNSIKNNFRSIRAAIVKKPKQPESIEISVDSPSPINSSNKTIEVKEAEIVTPQKQNQFKKDKKKKKNRRR